MQDFNQFNATAPSFTSVPWDSPAEPMYKHIARLLRADIEKGRYKKGEKLPSVRTMVMDFDVSHPTVLRALEELSATGHVRLVQGSGTYVHERRLLLNSVPASKLDDFSPRDSLKKPTIRSTETVPANQDSMLPFSQWQRCVRTALTELPSGNGIADKKGIFSLRQSIAAYIRRSRGIVVNEEQILVSAGLSQALSLVGRVFLSAGKTAAVEDPGSAKIRRLLAANGATIKAIELDAQGISVEALKNSNDQITLLHITPNHNPTGLLMPGSRRQSVLNWAAHRGVMILEDDFGADFSMSSNHEASLFADDQNNCVIYLGGFWGSLYPLVQIVYLLLPPELAARTHRDSLPNDCELPILEQLSLRHMLNDGHLELYLKRTKKIHMQKRACAISALKQTLGARIEIVGSGVNGKQAITFRQDVATRNVVTAALRSGLPLASTVDYFVDAKPSNQFLLSFAEMEEARIFETVLHFAGSIK